MPSWRTAIIYALSALTVVFAIILLLPLNVERSMIAERLPETPQLSVKVPDLIDGQWDAVCAISETAMPDLLLREVGYKDLTFSDAGNTFRSILLEGETGLISINSRSHTFGLYLVFDQNRVSIVPTVNSSAITDCFDFERATLNRHPISNDKWLYLTLGG